MLQNKYIIEKEESQIKRTIESSIYDFFLFDIEYYKEEQERYDMVRNAQRTMPTSYRFLVQ